MEIPKQAEQAMGLLQRAMKAVPVETKTPDVPSPDDSAPATRTTEKWRDGELGFLNEQLGDPERMNRYNVHLIIKTMRRVALVAVSAAGLGTGYIIRESDTRAVAVGLVILAWAITLAALVGATVLSLVPLPRSGSAEKALGESEREVEQASNPKTGEDGDHSGHHTPDQQ
jgi:hypothetical protein